MDEFLILLALLALFLSLVYCVLVTEDRKTIYISKKYSA